MLCAGRAYQPEKKVHRQDGAWRSTGDELPMAQTPYDTAFVRSRLVT
ncbi:hypothetical protein EPIR_2616 [Erwinia piriflorinigrans CFBP 5888]|uniref:Uncharacterized protein n=1 Tax=Erwinia piriflorinigrans CFBP 5888 TaxID=1161919 RepID=V5ZAM4_9GAMM|nr:hypothetical protein EPIR_2616 [Erwinia piriflorinigrans CFBP 5888]